MNKFIYQKDYPVVQTKEGALRGYEWKGTCIFKGIPYAHAQRFRKPERVKPWDGVKDVQSYGYVSPLLHPEQPCGNGEMMVPHMYWSEKEDCQNLNIWTPSIRDGRKRPVMVWLHGGGIGESQAECVGISGFVSVWRKIPGFCECRKFGSDCSPGMDPG